MPINSVSHALRLMELLGREPSLRISDIARLLGLPRPTVYRLVETLRDHSFVVEEEGRYRLTLKLLEIGSTVLSAAAIERAVLPALRALVASTGETAHFAVLDAGRAGYVAKVESDNPVRMFSRLGWRGPLHATAVGKALLAWPGDLRPGLVAEPLERFTARTIASIEQLRVELATIREAGFSVDKEELVEGLTCIAVPVQAGDRTFGAISVAGPTARLADPQKYLPALHEAAAAAAVSFQGKA